MEPKIAAAVEPLLREADRVLQGGYSAVLYGSAARGDYFERTSDINLLLLLPDASPATLRALGPAFRAWREKVAVPPLIITREEWAKADDVFPLELTDIRAAYQMLRGPDPVAGATVDRAGLRHALESELRGKLLRLRQGFALLEQEPKLLGALATHTLPTLLVLYRALLELHRRPVVPPSDAERVVREVALLVVASPEGSLAVVRHRAEPEWTCTSAQFEEYLAMVERAAHHVDHFQYGDS
ncbi:MAG TPA: nucleotidyltransferase domain-containing protein [Gemmatimonadales bacterium]|nr:nucleotidyltransferase domain-containing protein [Gemmatimonadales bacterium]